MFQDGVIKIWKHISIIWIMNKIIKLFETKNNRILSLFFTAGFPDLDSTGAILKALNDTDVDMVEIGMPYSDPVADGPVIQESSMKALDNGMSIAILFKQLQQVHDQVQWPILLMGYLNPVLQYGFERFCSDAARVGVDGLILPDMPPELYVEQFKKHMHQANLVPIFLISPETSDERIRFIDSISEGFIYMVSSPSVTGEKLQENDDILSYFERVRDLKLKHPRLVGFGISEPAQAKWVSSYANGVIIGSAFIQQLARQNSITKAVQQFIQPFTSV